MAVLGLRFCARAFSSCGKWSPLLIAVRGPSLSRPLLLRSTGSRRAGSVIVAHGPSCSSATPRPGLEPVSSALAGRFSTTAPPGKPPFLFFLEMLQILSISVMLYELINNNKLLSTYYVSSTI